MRAGRPPRCVRVRHAASAVVVALLAAGCGLGGDQPQTALDPQGPVAQAQHDLWIIVWPIALAVLILVFGVLGVAMVKFRATGNETSPPKQVHGNTRLEVLWTIIPALILVVIAVPTVRTIFELSGPPAADALEIDVVGKQYWWEFEYLNAEVANAAGGNVITASELHIPTGREIFIRLNGLPEEGDAKPAHVLHSFWVPGLAGKQDYVPGNEKTMRIVADDPGTYLGQCAEFCGLSHANMKFVVVAHEPGDFDAWIAAQAEPTGGDAIAGQNIIDEQGCLACHAVEGHPENVDVRVGPNLTHFAQRERFAGHIIDNDLDGDAANVRAWITNPQSLKPGAQMPQHSLSEEEMDALIDYLRTLD